MYDLKIMFCFTIEVNTEGIQIKLASLKSLLELFTEILCNSMLEEMEVSCNHQWIKRRLDCGTEGYYCPRCGKQTLP